MLEYVREALAVLAAERTRTALTALGLIIGVTAVIAIQVLGAGLAGSVTGLLGAFNDRSFTVFPNQRQADFTRAALRPDEIAKIPGAVPNVVQAIPAGAVARVVRAGHKRARLAVAPESNVRFFTTPIRYGRAFEAADVGSSRHVALLAAGAFERLYGPDAPDPTGSSLRLGDRRYVVVGVLAKPTTGILPNLVRGDVFVPYTTYERDLVRGQRVIAARFLVDDVTRIEATERATVEYLQRLKRGRAYYQTIDRKTLAGAIDGIFTGITLVVALIGAVSLVVAGIGILNIMLVSVAERTREIGLRKAIGATRTQVLAQFFIEALVLSALGCAVGLALGVSIGAIVDRVAIVRLAGVVPPIPWGRAIAIATGFATIVAVAFGTYPAWRAATLDPIEALRYE